MRKVKAVAPTPAGVAGADMLAVTLLGEHPLCSIAVSPPPVGAALVGFSYSWRPAARPGRASAVAGGSGGGGSGCALTSAAASFVARRVVGFRLCPRTLIVHERLQRHSPDCCGQH